LPIKKLLALLYLLNALKCQIPVGVVKKYNNLERGELVFGLFPPERYNRISPMPYMYF